MWRVAKNDADAESCVESKNHVYIHETVYRTLEKVNHRRAWYMYKFTMRRQSPKSLAN